MAIEQPSLSRQKKWRFNNLSLLLYLFFFLWFLLSSNGRKWTHGRPRVIHISLPHLSASLHSNEVKLPTRNSIYRWKRKGQMSQAIRAYLFIFQKRKNLRAREKGRTKSEVQRLVILKLGPLTLGPRLRSCFLLLFADLDSYRERNRYTKIKKSTFSWGWSFLKRKRGRGWMGRARDEKLVGYRRRFTNVGFFHNLLALYSAVCLCAKCRPRHFPNTTWCNKPWNNLFQ